MEGYGSARCEAAHATQTCVGTVQPPTPPKPAKWALGLFEERLQQLGDFSSAAIFNRRQQRAKGRGGCSRATNREEVNRGVREDDIESGAESSELYFLLVVTYRLPTAGRRHWKPRPVQTLDSMGEHAQNGKRAMLPLGIEAYRSSLV